MINLQATLKARSHMFHWAINSDKNSDVNKDLTLKAKAKDSTFKAKAKDSAFKAKAKDSTFKAKAKDFRCVLKDSSRPRTTTLDKNGANFSRRPIAVDLALHTLLSQAVNEPTSVNITAQLILGIATTINDSTEKLTILNHKFTKKMKQ